MIYEVITGQILLSKRRKFFELHSETLLPIMKEVGIAPKIMLLTELGRYCRFLDIYEYSDLATYDRMTEALLQHPDIEPYYEQVGDCIFGSINVEIMRDFPYSQQWIKE